MASSRKNDFFIEGIFLKGINDGPVQSSMAVGKAGKDRQKSLTKSVC
jgi:hypothetical protein